MKKTASALLCVIITATMGSTIVMAQERRPSQSKAVTTENRPLLKTSLTPSSISNSYAANIALRLFGNVGMTVATGAAISLLLGIATGNPAVLASGILLTGFATVPAALIGIYQGIRDTNKHRNNLLQKKPT